MYIIISTSTNKESVADVISKTLLKKQLSPCINTSTKSKSSYILNDEIIKDQEYVISIKTIETFKEEIVTLIKKYHNYKTPEIISTKIEILSDEYRQWYLNCLQI